MPIWLIAVKETGVNLRSSALGAGQVLGLQAPGTGGHFWVGGFGGGAEEGRSQNGPGL